MKIYLVQHGLSKPKEEDAERPLSEAGQREIEQVAVYAAKHAGIQIKTIGHSGKKRARQTAEILGEHLKPPNGVAAVRDLEPMDDPNLWVKRFGFMSDDIKLVGKRPKNIPTDDVMLVGHLPQLAGLASLLLAGNLDKPVVTFQNGGIVCLQKTVSGDWSLLWTITPELVAGC